MVEWEIHSFELIFFLENYMSILAHIRKIDKEEQKLKDHLFGVACLSAKFASKIGLEKHGYLIGLLHDLGKYSSEFQHYLKSPEGLLNPSEDDMLTPMILRLK